MTTLPDFEVGYSLFLHKTTIIYGESGTGKSTIITDILHSLKPHIEQILVICPTDKQNKTYESGIVPLPCIHYGVNEEVLKNLWDRQQAMVTTYERANNVETLQKLFDRLPNSSSHRDIISSIRVKLQDCIGEIKKSDHPEGEKLTRIQEMKEKYTDFILLIMRKVINDNCSYLARLNLSEDERYSMRYMNINPNMVLIFDDCTEQLNKIKKNQVLQSLFYAGRHNRITAIFAAHTEKALTSEIKNNCFVTMFTETGCANLFFGRDSMGFSKEVKSQATNAIRSAFNPMLPNQKLVFIRQGKKFYKYTATRHGAFRFGSPYIWDFCEKVQVNKNSLPTSNKFASYFV